MSVLQRSNIEVNLSAIANNVKILKKKILRTTKLMAVVKADAYGHGATTVSVVALANGADYLGVATAAEALSLRKNGLLKDLLVLGATFSHYIDECVLYDIEQTVFDFATAAAISASAERQKKTAYIHIKIDTGMNRIGFIPSVKSVEEICKINNLPNLEIKGIYSHFAESDAHDKVYSHKQAKCFNTFCKQLEKFHITPSIKHMANSGAVLSLPEYQYDMVRSGIAMYGLSPSDIFNMNQEGFLPALSFKTMIAQIKVIEKGESVGYGRAFLANRITRVAIIPIGYADGYPRSLSNNGHVMISGQYAPIIGNICMDQMMVDVSDIDKASIGDEAVLIGRHGNNEITVDDIAKQTGTINYEIICAVGRRSDKIYLNNI